MVKTRIINGLAVAGALVSSVCTAKSLVYTLDMNFGGWAGLGASTLTLRQASNGQLLGTPGVDDSVWSTMPPSPISIEAKIVTSPYGVELSEDTRPLDNTSFSGVLSIINRNEPGANIDVPYTKLRFLFNEPLSSGSLSYSITPLGGTTLTGIVQEGLILDLPGYSGPEGAPYGTFSITSSGQSQVPDRNNTLPLLGLGLAGLAGYRSLEKRIAEKKIDNLSL